MKKKSLVVFQYLIFSIPSFFVCQFIYQNFLMMRVSEYLFVIYNPENGDFWVSLAIILLLTFLMATVIYALIHSEIPKISFGVLAISYFVTLVFFLFFKSVGSQGLNLNPFSWISQLLTGNGIEVLFNVIYFLPIGLLIKRFSIKVVMIAVGSLFLIEGCQYFFHLGIFDLGDIFLNFSGIVGGYLLRKESKINRIFGSLRS
ncbi:VanZ family protein [Lactococcus insecticola]|uniref:Antibiotic resistance protein VanZ n=1 Tax=Pseudolactococcus insecticola TaxID=2709158 RepID=A0A6A0B7N9_9LACT|nr:VanZ family protein [Lactococcus insecticola]GFH40471.1 antibiotic resistance protein VanZ [Lactococcus insecticola]